MRVLIACEFSGTVRDAFRARGHHAVSCDLLPTERVGSHYQGDVTDLLDGYEPVRSTAEIDPEGDGYCTLCLSDDCGCIGPTQDGVEYAERSGVLMGRPIDRPDWDLMIAFPPCTHLAVSGAKHFAAKRADGRQAEAVAFAKKLWGCPVPRVALENPVGVLSRHLGSPSQIVQPWYFGDPHTKTTCLWLRNLPRLVPTKLVDKGARHVTKGGRSLPEWYNLPPSEDRAKIRSQTFPGLAEAMADQWDKADEIVAYRELSLWGDE